MKTLPAIYESVANLLKSRDQKAVDDGVKKAKVLLAVCLETDDPGVYLDLMIALMIYTEAIIIREEGGIAAGAVRKQLEDAWKRITPGEES